MISCVHPVFGENKGDEQNWHGNTRNSARCERKELKNFFGILKASLMRFNGVLRVYARNVNVAAFGDHKAGKTKQAAGSSCGHPRTRITALLRPGEIPNSPPGAIYIREELFMDPALCAPLRSCLFILLICRNDPYIKEEIFYSSYGFIVNVNNITKRLHVILNNLTAP